MAKSRRTATLLETTMSDSSLKVDRENRVVRGVKILGRESRNGRTYTESALQEASSLYEGATVNVNHPKRSEPNAERGFDEGIGVLRNSSVKADGVYGDLHYFESHPHAPLMLERAEKHPTTFGLSHNADGHTATVRGKNVVESITKVRSVDLVARPATTNGLFESENPVKRTIAQLLETVDAKTTGHARLTEMVEGDPTLDAVEMPAMEPEDAAKQNPEDQIKAGILAAIMSKLEAAGEAEITAVLAALGMGDSPAAAAAGKKNKPEGDAVAESKLESVLESVQAKLNSLESKLNAKDAEQSAVSLLESLDREATGVRVKALLGVPAADRKALVESWPKRASYPGVGNKPRRETPLTESEQPGDREYKSQAPKEFSAALR